MQGCDYSCLSSCTRIFVHVIPSLLCPTYIAETNQVSQEPCPYHTTTAYECHRTLYEAVNPDGRGCKIPPGEILCFGPLRLAKGFSLFSLLQSEAWPIGHPFHVADFQNAYGRARRLMITAASRYALRARQQGNFVEYLTLSCRVTVVP